MSQQATPEAGKPARKRRVGLEEKWAKKRVEQAGNRLSKDWWE
jgi:hypothetical protein